MEWWPVSRDSLMYGVAVLMLINVLRDGRIEMTEALSLVLAYIFYILSKIRPSFFIHLYLSQIILVMCFNDRVSKFAHRIVNSCKKKRQFKEIPNENQPLLSQNKIENGNGTVGGDTLESDLTLKDIDELGKSYA